MSMQQKIVGVGFATVSIGVVALALIAGKTPAVAVTDGNQVQVARKVESASAEPTLWGIYGEHDKHDCPVNNRETAKQVIALSVMDLRPLMEKYGVTAFLDRYHSGLEHTFLWAVETTNPHQLEEFSIELGIARFNNLKFVPLMTFEEGVVPLVRGLHGLDDWDPKR